MTLRVAADASEVITQRRKNLGLARERLGAQAGVTGRTVYNLETGRGEPQVGTVLAVALALGLAAEDVLAEPQEFDRLIPKASA